MMDAGIVNDEDVLAIGVCVWGLQTRCHHCQPLCGLVWQLQVPQRLQLIMTTAANTQLDARALSHTCVACRSRICSKSASAFAMQRCSTASSTRTFATAQCDLLPHHFVPHKCLPLFSICGASDLHVAQHLHCIDQRNDSEPFAGVGVVVTCPSWIAYLRVAIPAWNYGLSHCAWPQMVDSSHTL